MPDNPTLFDLERLQTAIELSEDILRESSLSMSLVKKSELVALIYVVLDEDAEELLTLIDEFLSEEMI